MINRTKIASLAVCAILSAAVLTGCGGSSASSSTASSAAPAASSQAASSVVSSAAAEENGASDLDGIYIALLQADPISNQFEIAAMNIEYDFGLQAEDVVSYKGVKSNDNGDAGLVLVIEAADGKAEDIANQLTAYQQDQVAFYGNYAEFAQAQRNVEHAVIAYKDNRVVMASASNECTADLDSAVDSALNSLSELIRAGATAASAFVEQAQRRLTLWGSAPLFSCSAFCPSRWRCTILPPQN